MKIETRGDHARLDPAMSIIDNSQSYYDEINIRYTATRRADARIARRIHEALGDAESIAHVSAGAGAYEPSDRKVLPIEPSELIIAQRPPELPAAIKGHPENLPLPADSVDAAMACMTLHHWSDWRIGVNELRRVARKRVVIFTYDPSCVESFWLLRDYLPELGQLDYRRFPAIDEQCVAAGEDVQLDPVPVPHDCDDGFLTAYWRRPSAYLDKNIRMRMSSFHSPGSTGKLDGLERLAEDLRTGQWAARNEDILECEELDLGYRLLVTEL